MKKYKFLDHPADIKIQSFGKDLAELFTNSALGMMAFLYETDDVKITRTDHIEIEADNLESLLIDWLSEILYLSDTHYRNYCDYKITFIDEKKIIAEVGSGEAVAKNDIKAVTYHDLKIEKKDHEWVATVVYDI